jgi:predicted peptidase
MSNPVYLISVLSIAITGNLVENTGRETGKTMTYSLYVPKDYDKSICYPLVLFMADGSTTGKGSEAPLKQGYGAIIWATEESQAKNPCFVLVPAYAGPRNIVNDNWEVSDEVDMTLRLLDYQDPVLRENTCTPFIMLTSCKV